MMMAAEELLEYYHTEHLCMIRKIG
jgi:hypothetical protein